MYRTSRLSTMEESVICQRRMVINQDFTGFVSRNFIVASFSLDRHPVIRRPPLRTVRVRRSSHPECDGGRTPAFCETEVLPAWSRQLLRRNSARRAKNRAAGGEAALFFTESRLPLHPVELEPGNTGPDETPARICRFGVHALPIIDSTRNRARRACCSSACGRAASAVRCRETPG